MKHLFTSLFGAGISMALLFGCDNGHDPVTPNLLSEHDTHNEETVSIDSQEMVTVQEMEAMAKQYNEAINMMEQHMRIENGQLVVELPANSKSTIDESILNNLTDSLAETNRQIQSGEIQISNIHLGESGTDEMIQAGWTGIKRYWWGVRTYLNDTKTHGLLWAMAIGSGVSQYFAPYGTLFSWALRIAAPAISYIDARGGHRGVYFNTTWNGYGYVWHQ